MGFRLPFLRPRWLLVAGAVAAAILAVTLTIGARSQADRPPAAAVDLAIGETPGLGQQGIDGASRPAVRPGILVAWRNTERVLEIETLVQNHGQAAATGQ